MTRPAPLLALIRIRETRDRLREITWQLRWPHIAAELRVQRATAP